MPGPQAGQRLAARCLAGAAGEELDNCRDLVAEYYSDDIAPKCLSRGWMRGTSRVPVTVVSVSSLSLRAAGSLESCSVYLQTGAVQ